MYGRIRFCKRVLAATLVYDGVLLIILEGPCSLVDMEILISVYMLPEASLYALQEFESMKAV